MTNFFYRVDNGDTLVSIAQTLKVAPFKLIKLNNLKKEVEQGDLLYIEKPKNSKLYKVQPLDTLESIAQKFCVDKTELLLKNGVEYIFYGLIIEL